MPYRSPTSSSARPPRRLAARPRPSWPGAAGLAAEALAAVVFVIAVYETVVGVVVRVWPDARDDLVLLLWIAAAAICGAGMKAVRVRARRLLARRWPSVAADPYTALMSFVAEASAAGSAEDALPSLAALVAEGTGARTVEIWLAGEHGLEQAAVPVSVPGSVRVPGSVAVPASVRVPVPVPDLDVLRVRPDIQHVLPVTDAGELLGALLLGTGDGAELAAPDLQLANDIANSAGLLLRNADLDARLRERIHEESEQAEALRVSRRRVVVARDDARRQLGREIQSVVCEPLERCALELNLLRERSAAGGGEGAEGDESADAQVAQVAQVAEMAEVADLEPELAGMARRVDTVIRQFRRVVHGVYPSVLTDHGLVAALGNLVADLERRAELDAPELPRLPAPIESAGYFCVAALLHAWPHSRDKDPIRVAVAATNGELTVTIGDPVARTGTDLVDPLVLESALDRIAALEGRLEQVADSSGLTVVITLPVIGEAASPEAREEDPAGASGRPHGQEFEAPSAAVAAAHREPGRLFNRALTYAVLLPLIGVAYVAGVVRIDAAFGLSSDWLAPPQLAASGLVALALAPVHSRLNRWADRLVFGRRAPRYEVLAQVSALSQTSGPAPATLDSLARITAEGLAVASAAVHVELPDGSEAVHRWPEGAEAATSAYRMPVLYGDATVGAIVLPEQARRDLAPDRRRLLDDLARSAGVILHNAGLTAELRARLRSLEDRSAEIRASRWRIVAAQDTERRELERDLHDGAQPGLTAVRLTLGLLSHLAARGDRDAVEKSFDQAQERISDALRGLRRILGGLDPQTLAGHGLGPALRERAEALGCTARFDASPELAAERFDPAVESAVYYCCAEALQNTAKHAPGAPVTLSLTLDRAASRLHFTVSDEGPGFATDRTERGAGLQNMSDRVSAVGGELELHSAPGAGTRITAWVPAVRVPSPTRRPAQAALSSPARAQRGRAKATQAASPHVATGGDTA